MVLPTLALTFVLQQSPPLRQLKVASCPAADSLLGPPRQDRDGAVRGSYDAAQDSTFLVTGTGRLPDARRPDDYIFSVVVRFEGRALSDYPAAQFNVLVRGSNALRIHGARSEGALSCCDMRAASAEEVTAGGWV